MATLDLKDFDGVKLPEEFEPIKHQIKNFTVGNEDIWVTSYPKSGTTWTQEMVWLLSNNLDYKRAETDLDLRFPFIELNATIDAGIRFGKKHNLYNGYTNTKIDHVKILEQTENNRFIKTHLPWDFLPEEILNGTKFPKIIHTIRNPKQIVPSYYNHAAKVFPFFVGSLDEFVDFYIKGNVLHGDYFRTVLSYWNEKHRPNLLILTYEEMCMDLLSVVKRVSKFLEKSYSEDELRKLVHHLNFDQMKLNPAVNKQKIIKDETRSFIRKGVIDSYKTELSLDMINKLNDWVNEKTKGTRLPYEQWK